MSVVGTKFPAFKATLLTGEKIKLPNFCQGSRVMIVLIFHRSAQLQANAWYTVYRMRFEAKGYRFLEIQLFSSKLYLVRGAIDEGHRMNVPDDHHSSIATYFGPLKVITNSLSIEDKHVPYVFWIEPDGTIQDQHSGYPSHASHPHENQHSEGRINNQDDDYHPGD